MKKTVVLKSILLILLSIVCTAALVESIIMIGRYNVNSNFKANYGIIEPDAGILESGQLIPLDGNWGFYPGEYISSADEAKGDPVSVKVPGDWYDSGIAGEGIGTYRLVLKLPEMNERLSVRITGNILPFKLFVNGENIAQEGAVGYGASDTEYSMKTVVASFEPQEENEIFIQTCNYKLDSGLIRYSIFLGAEEGMAKVSTSNISRDWMILGALFIMALYYLILFVNNKNKVTKATLLMFILCILDILYAFNSNEYLIYNIFPNISCGAIDKMVYALPTCGGTMLIYFVDVFYRDMSWKPAKNISTIKAAVLMAVMVFFSYSFSLGGFTLSNVLMEIEFLYSIAILSYAISRKRPYAVSILAATVILNAAIIYTVLYYANIASSPYGGMVSLGNIVVILCFATVVAVDLNESYKAVIRLSENLTEATKLKDEFLTNTSHEIRTPLNSMVALTESVILEAGDTISEEQKDTLMMVTANGRRLASLVNDILDYSKMKNGDLTLVLSVFSAENLLGRLKREFTLLAEKKSIDLQYDVEKQLPLVYADEHRIIQVVYNLVGNALKFTNGGGWIKISAWAEKDAIYVSVQDNGTGIAENRINDIFKSFEQADATVAERFGGLGLGLSISKQIVESHGMRITVKSKLGEGSAFTFGIPVSTETSIIADNENDKGFIHEPNKSVFQEDRIVIEGAKGKTIIIIDDNYDNIAGAAGILKTEGYGIRGFTSAEEGIKETFSNGQAVSVILDLMMPEISGYEVCEQIRKRFSLLEMPILILTAKVQTDSITRALKSGANDYLCKPFDANELIARVNTLIRLKEVSELAVASETKFLQAQIKPHFLYNALNTISALCIDDGEKASDLIDYLCIYLRNSFNTGDQTDLVNLEKELEIVTAYVEIEKARFGEKIRVEYEIDYDTKCMLPPLVLQPLVENSIRHGLVKKEGGGTVRVGIYQSVDGIYFAVSDDGAGIAQENPADLLNYAGGNDGVGLININKRLVKNFGHGLKIQSKPGEGTVVSFFIPKKLKIGGLPGDQCDYSGR